MEMCLLYLQAPFQLTYVAINASVDIKNHRAITA